MEGGKEPVKLNMTLQANLQGHSDAKLSYLKVHVKKIFDKYDLNKGFLDIDDFTKLLNAQSKKDHSEQEVLDLMKRIKKNENDVISQEELYALYEDLYLGGKKA